MIGYENVLSRFVEWRFVNIFVVYPYEKNQMLAQYLQTRKIILPPVIFPKNNAKNTIGITMIISAMNMMKAYRQYNILIGARRNFMVQNNC